MNGARHFATLFETGQHERLYLVSGSHARGRTFNIYVLPDGEAAIPNGSQNPPLNKDAVEVYGVVSGNPGWTESYGWLHAGRWQNDFADMVAKREAGIAASTCSKKVAANLRQASEEAKQAILLASY